MRMMELVDRFGNTQRINPLIGFTRVEIIGNCIFLTFANPRHDLDNYFPMTIEEFEAEHAAAQKLC